MISPHLWFHLSFTQKILSPRLPTNHRAGSVVRFRDSFYSFWLSPYRPPTPATLLLPWHHPSSFWIINQCPFSMQPWTVCTQMTAQQAPLLPRAKAEEPGRWCSERRKRSRTKVQLQSTRWKGLVSHNPQKAVQEASWPQMPWDQLSLRREHRTPVRPSRTHVCSLSIDSWVTSGNSASHSEPASQAGKWGQSPPSQGCLKITGKPWVQSLLL